MRPSSIRPADYAEDSIEVTGDDDLHPQTRTIRRRSRPRCVRFGALLLVILLLIIAVITIPVLIKRSCKKNQDETPPTPTMDHSHSSTTTTSDNGTETFTTSSALSETKTTSTKGPATSTTTPAPSKATTTSTNGPVTSTTTPAPSKATTTSTKSPATSTTTPAPSKATTTSTKSPTTSTTTSAPESTDGTSIKTFDDQTSMTSSVSPDYWSQPDIISGTSADDAGLYSSYSIITTESTPAELTIDVAERPLVFLNHPGDFILGLYNTAVNQSAGAFNDVNSTTSGEEQFSMMDSSTKTRHFNRGCVPGSNVSYSCGLGTGFLVIPFNGTHTVVRALLFATASQRPKRDPMNCTLEGSNATSEDTLRQGVSWSLIYQGPTGITTPSNRSSYGIQQNFPNETPYSTYRVLITSVRGPEADAVQYSEARILGYIWS